VGAVTRHPKPGKGGGLPADEIPATRDLPAWNWARGGQTSPGWVTENGASGGGRERDRADGPAATLQMVSAYPADRRRLHAGSHGEREKAATDSASRGPTREIRPRHRLQRGVLRIRGGAERRRLRAGDRFRRHGSQEVPRRQASLEVERGILASQCQRPPRADDRPVRRDAVPVRIPPSQGPLFGPR